MTGPYLKTIWPVSSHDEQFMTERFPVSEQSGVLSNALTRLFAEVAEQLTELNSLDPGHVNQVVYSTNLLSVYVQLAIRETQRFYGGRQ